MPGNLRKPILGEISTSNSSTTPLDTGTSFTGVWEDVSGWQDVVVAVKTDQNGHFIVQFSPDGSNVDSSLTRYYRTTQIEAPHRFTITRQYMRVVFTNDSGTNQTYFRLQTTVGQRGDLNAPLDSNLAQDFDAIVTRPTDYTTEVALGRRQGASTWNKFGYNTAVGTTEEVIASWSTAFQFLTAGETLSIVSTSTADTSGGTGAQSVVVYGVDQNWDEAIEVVVLTGTTPVVTTSQWIGINRVAIYLAGTGQVNAGDINVTASSSGYTLAQIPTGSGTSQQCVFYVPRDHQFLATWLTFSAIKTSGGGNPQIFFDAWVYSAVSNARYEVFRYDMDTQIEERIELNPAEPFIVGEKSIFWLEASANSGTTNSVKGRFSGKLIRDVDA